MYFHHEYAFATRVVADHKDPYEALHRAEALAAHRAERQARLALQRFYLLYRLRNVLFRFTPGLAKWLAL